MMACECKGIDRRRSWVVIKQIEVPIKGVVKGFQMPDESLEDAQARTVLEAEQFGNAGMVSAASPMTIRYGRSRIHLSIDEKGK